MNVLLAAGLFDSPWIIVLLILGSALTNWLARRKQEKQERQDESALEDQEESPSPHSARRSPPELDLEHTLRRLFGDETHTPAPPPLPSWSPPPVLPEPATFTLNVARDLEERHFEPAPNPVRQPASAASRRSRAARPAYTRWRDPRSARQAFIAALIFAPPKSLERDGP